jgi:putative nucleotidyltransferase with HDIG domain
MDRATLERILTDESLPTLPAVAQQVTARMQDPDISVREIAEILQHDPVLTTRVLRLVNSPYYGLAQPITNIKQGVAMIGLNQVKVIVLTTQVMKSFQYKGDPEVFTFRMFWEHALTTAIAAETIAETTPGIDPSDAFIGGLLHDIGKLLIAIYFPEYFEELINRLKMESDRLPHELEPSILGADHAQIGGWFMRQWKLSEDLAEGVERHHRPTVKQHPHLLASIIHTADILARGIGLGSAAWDKVPPYDQHAWKLLKANTENLQMWCSRIRHKVDMARDFFKLIREEEQQIQHT